jgi:endonuclease/exonuclease/phosphatase family metal-dependent hydrolase
MLRILTQNAAQYDDAEHAPWPARLEALARSVADARPDLVAFQEVRFNPAHPSTRATYRNMAEQVLARVVELRPEYAEAVVLAQPAMHHPRGTPRLPSVSPPRAWEGLAVLSRLPVLETSARFLSVAPGCEDDTRRVVQHVVVEARGGPFHLFNAHFALPDHPSRACVEANAAETLEHVRRRAEGPSFALVGDLNVTPEEPLLDRFRDAGLVDAWHLRHPRDPGYTWNATERKGPTKRFDYVWVPEALREKVMDVGQVNAEPWEGTFASDHRGVVVDLDI